jgi:predicted DNA-binding transcriptional regulator AlpA
MSQTIQSVAALLDVRAAAACVGLSVSTLNKLRIAGAGPLFVKLGHAVRYRPEDLASWIATNVRGSTSEGASPSDPTGMHGR